MTPHEPFKQDELLKSPALFKYGPFALLLAGLVLSVAALCAGKWRVDAGRQDLYEGAFAFSEAAAISTAERLDQSLSTAQQATVFIDELLRQKANAAKVVHGNQQLLGALGKLVVSRGSEVLATSEPLSIEEARWLTEFGPLAGRNPVREQTAFEPLDVADARGFVLPLVHPVQGTPTHVVTYFLSGESLLSPAKTALAGRPGRVAVALTALEGAPVFRAFNAPHNAAQDSKPVRTIADGMSASMDYKSTRMFEATAKAERASVTVGIQESAVLSVFEDRVFYTWLIVYSTSGFILLVVCSTGFAIRKFAHKEEYLRRIATIDVLTGLPNRRSFHNLLGKAVENAKRGRPLALFFIDLDNFKYVNDSLGHGAGDELLKHVAAVLSRTVRDGDQVCRLAGDEFTVLSLGVEGSAAAHKIAERLLAALREVFVLNGVELQVKASVGIALMPFHADDASELMRFADTAMHRAKQDCKGTVVVYDDAIAEKALQQANAVRELERAIKGEELFLVYQPKYEMDTGNLAGHEALVRWAHPTRGVVFPGEFIPLAESSGLIGDLGSWALHRAVRQIREWHEQGHDWHKVAVNVSALQLKSRAFVDVVKQALRENDVDGALLHLELTESSLAKDAALVQSIIGELKREGVCFAIDDFGTGYSSLGALQQFDIDFLKVDRSFVSALGTDAGEEICRAVVSLGHALKMRVVAEGVETQEQAVALKRLGCDLAQGYLYAKPQAADKAVLALCVEVPCEDELLV